MSRPGTSVQPSYTNGKRIEGSQSETHHIQRLLAEKGEVPCDCLEWIGGVFDVPDDRNHIGFRCWTAVTDCKRCKGEGSHRP